LLQLSRTFRRLPSDSLHSESLRSNSHSICCNPGQCWLRFGARSKKLAHHTAEPVHDTLIGNDMDHVKECIRAKRAPSRTAEVMTCQRPRVVMKIFRKIRPIMKLTQSDEPDTGFQEHLKQKRSGIFEPYNLSTR